MEASALSAPAALRRPTWQPVRLLRLRSDEQLVALFRAERAKCSLIIDKDDL